MCCRDLPTPLLLIAFMDSPTFAFMDSPTCAICQPTAKKMRLLNVNVGIYRCVVCDKAGRCSVHVNDSEAIVEVQMPSQSMQSSCCGVWK